MGLGNPFRRELWGLKPKKSYEEQVKELEQHKWQTEAKYQQEAKIANLKKDIRKIEADRSKVRQPGIGSQLFKSAGNFLGQVGTVPQKQQQMQMKLMHKRRVRKIKPLMYTMVPVQTRPVRQTTRQKVNAEVKSSQDAVAQQQKKYMDFMRSI